MLAKAGEAIGIGLREKENMKNELVEAGGIHTRFLLGKYRVKIRTTKLLIEKRAINDSFIWGHPSNGIWGTAKWGDRRGSWNNVELKYDIQKLTTAGREEIAKWLAGESANYAQYAAFGDGTAEFSEDDTALSGTEIDRVETSADTNTDKILDLQVEVKSAGNTLIGNTVSEVGIFNASSGGTLFTRYPFTSLSLTNDYEYRFTIRFELDDDGVYRGITTTAGLNAIRDWIGTGSITAPSHCAWGTGTTDPSASDTILEGEVVRNAITQTIRDGNSVTFETLLAASDATGQTLYKSGIFNASSGGTLFWEQKFAQIAKTDAFQVFEIDNILIT